MIKTKRGFDLMEFNDRYNKKCSLQKSSLASEDCIWLGIDDANPRILVEGFGWQKIEADKDILYDTRMHLTREQVKDLLPVLTKFVETGEIND